MLQNFFKLNDPVSKIASQDEFITHFDRANSLKNVMYEPDLLDPPSDRRRLKEISFENVSFSKTNICNTNFTECVFKDTLFIGTTFNNCEFHDCKFINCNTHKVQFLNCYVNPEQFHKMLNPKLHSNIGVWLFQQLLKNSLDMRQPDFTRIAEYHFRKWQRYQLVYEARKGQMGKFRFVRKWIPDFLYDLFAGYGLRAAPFLTWTVIIFTVIFLINHFSWSLFQMKGNISDLNIPSLTKTFYYTVITISTVGYGDITPTSSPGMIIAGIEALFGIVWLSILASIIIKRIVR